MKKVERWNDSFNIKSEFKNEKQYQDYIENNIELYYLSKENNSKIELI